MCIIDCWYSNISVEPNGIPRINSIAFSSEYRMNLIARLCCLTNETRDHPPTNCEFGQFDLFYVVVDDVLVPRKFTREFNLNDD